MGGGGSTREDIQRPPDRFRDLQDLSVNAMQNTPEGLKDPLRQVVGRVVANTVIPTEYTSGGGDADSKMQQIGSLFNKANIWSTIKSIAKDEPAYANEIGGYNYMPFARDAVAAGIPLMREYFNLPRKDSFTVPVQDERGAERVNKEYDLSNIYDRDGKNYRINPETTNEAARSQLQTYRNDLVQGANQPNQYTPSNVDPRFKYDYLGGNYMVGHPDPWNFDPSQKELDPYKGKTLPMQLFGRQLLEAIGKPAVLQTGGNYYNPAPNEDMLPVIMRLLGR